MFNTPLYMCILSSLRVICKQLTAVNELLKNCRVLNHLIFIRITWISIKPVIILIQHHDGCIFLLYTRI